MTHRRADRRWAAATVGPGRSGRAVRRDLAGLPRRPVRAGLAPARPSVRGMVGLVATVAFAHGLPRGRSWVRATTSARSSNAHPPPAIADPRRADRAGRRHVRWRRAGGHRHRGLRRGPSACCPSVPLGRSAVAVDRRRRADVSADLVPGWDPALGIGLRGAARRGRRLGHAAADAAQHRPVARPSRRTPGSPSRRSATGSPATCTTSSATR